MEKKLKHLEFIQGVINRLAANSFQMKGWYLSEQIATRRRHASDFHRDLRQALGQA